MGKQTNFHLKLSRCRRSSGRGMRVFPKQATSRRRCNCLKGFNQIAGWYWALITLAKRLICRSIPSTSCQSHRGANSWSGLSPRHAKLFHAPTKYRNAVYSPFAVAISAWIPPSRGQANFGSGTAIEKCNAGIQRCLSLSVLLNRRNPPTLPPWQTAHRAGQATQARVRAAWSKAEQSGHQPQQTSGAHRSVPSLRPPTKR